MQCALIRTKIESVLIRAFQYLECALIRANSYAGIDMGHPQSVLIRANCSVDIDMGRPIYTVCTY